MKRCFVPFYRLSILIPLIALALACKYFQLPEHLASEAAKDNPNRTINDSPIFLNRDSNGRISDIDRPRTMTDLGETSIDQRLALILRDRESNGILFDGTNIVACSVYLLADPELSMAAFSKLYLGIDRAATAVYIPKEWTPPPQSGPPQRPSPYTLIADTQPPGERPGIASEWPLYDPDYQHSYNLDLEIAKSSDQLKSMRMSEDSIEISADERFFRNEKQGPEADQGPRLSRVKQRLINAEDLNREFAALDSGYDPKLVIVSARASYGSLRRFLEQINDPKARFRIVVRPDVFEQTAGKVL